MMTFSLCHASARPHAWREARDRWLKRAKHPERVEHILAIEDAHLFPFDPTEPTRPVINTFRHDCVSAWNAAAEASMGEVLIAMADDFTPPDNWDCELEAVIKDATKEAVVQVSTGVPMTDRSGLLALSILTRARYTRVGYLFYPMYRSMFCDNDFTEHAVADKVILDASHLMFKHHHPVTKEAPWDPVYQQQNAPERYQEGEVILQHRRTVEFSNAGRIGVQVLAADAFMLEESVRTVVEDAEAVYLQIPTELWCGKPVPGREVEKILDLAGRLWAEGYRVYHNLIDVGAERLPGRDRYQVEAAVRNKGLEFIRHDGLEANLIVDSDELWLPECFHRVLAALYEGVTALTVRMIPVIGMPAYPVDGATDAALILLAGGQKFTSCRGTQGAVALSERLVLHFTGTRATCEAIAEKMRQSGHYGDLDYDFEGWIRDTLPGIRPGMRNAHMFKPYQIWPSVREFTKRELREIPQRLHPFLGTGNGPQAPPTPPEKVGATGKCVSYAYFDCEASVYASMKGHSSLQFEQFLSTLIRAHHIVWGGWDMVLHHDDFVRDLPYFSVLEHLRDAGLINLVPCGNPPSLCGAMLWRVLPIYSGKYEIVACRDIDAIPTLRDRKAVDEFIASGLALHVIHDNPQHVGVMGGTITIRSEDFIRLISQRIDPRYMTSPAWNRQGADQILLNQKIAPLVKGSMMLHISNPRDSMGLPLERVRPLSGHHETADDLTPGIGVCVDPPVLARAFHFYDSLDVPIIRKIREIEAEAYGKSLSASMATWEE